MVDGISREEFTSTMDRVFCEVGKVQKCMTDVKVNIAKLQTSFDDLDVPALPERPCTDLKEHLTDHKQAKEKWGKPVIACIVITLFLLLQEPLKWVIQKILLGD
jgi:hypothetical protein